MERRDDLMRSAEQLFLEKGWGETAVEEITAGAGVAKGTFYLHFASKAEIIDALRERFVQDLLAAIGEAVEARGAHDWTGRLAAWGRACAGGYLDAARLHHLVFVAAKPASQEGLTRNVLIDHLTALLSGGVAEGAWSIDDPHFTAVFLFNAVHGVANQPTLENTPSHREELLRAIEAHLLRTADITLSRP